MRDQPTRNLLLIQVSRLQSPHLFRQGSCSGWKDSGLGTQRFQTPGSLLPWSILKWGFMICSSKGLSLFPVILVNKYLGFMMYDGHHLQGMVLDWCWPITLFLGRITYPHLLGKRKASSKVRICYIVPWKVIVNYQDFFYIFRAKIIDPKINLHLATIASCPTSLIRSDHLKVSDRHSLDEFPLRSLQMIAPAQNRSK